MASGTGADRKGPIVYPLKGSRVFMADRLTHFNELFVPRHVRENVERINKRQERVKIDQEIRHGKEIVQRRSDFVEWNYDAELAAFQARIRETFDDAKLRQSFVTFNYMQSEYLKKKELGIVDSVKTEPDEDDYVKQEENALVLSSDELSEIRTLSQFQLSKEGSEFIADTLSGFVRVALPKLPEEGVEAIVKYLTKDEVLAHVGFHIGIKDLILCEVRK